MTYLLMEQIDSDIKSVKKSTPTKAIFEAILQTAGVNRNKRHYSKEIINEALQDAMPRMQDRTFVGELDHPIPTADESYSYVRHVTPSLKEVSHMILDYHWEGDKVIGTVETTSTPNGYILAGLIHDGMKVGFSIRALANNLEQRPDGIMEVLSPMTIIAIDAVTIPSHAEAKIVEVKTLESYLQEQSLCENGQCIIKEHLEKTKKLTMINEHNTFQNTNSLRSFYNSSPFKF